MLKTAIVIQEEPLVLSLLIIPYIKKNNGTSKNNNSNGGWSSQDGRPTATYNISSELSFTFSILRDKTVVTKEYQSVKKLFYITFPMVKLGSIHKVCQCIYFNNYHNCPYFSGEFTKVKKTLNNTLLTIYINKESI